MSRSSDRGGRNKMASEPFEAAVIARSRGNRIVGREARVTRRPGVEQLDPVVGEQASRGESINAEQFSQYVEFVADRRLERLGLPRIYERENPFPWMSQATDLSKEKNFFETRVTEYQVGASLDWD